MHLLTIELCQIDQRAVFLFTLLVMLHDLSSKKDYFIILCDTILCPSLTIVQREGLMLPYIQYVL